MLIIFSSCSCPFISIFPFVFIINSTSSAVTYPLAGSICFTMYFVFTFNFLNVFIWASVCQVSIIFPVSFSIICNLDPVTNCSSSFISWTLTFVFCPIKSFSIFNIACFWLSLIVSISTSVSCNTYPSGASISFT